jgi:hypothetical protein
MDTEERAAKDRRIAKKQLRDNNRSVMEARADLMLKERGALEEKAHKSKNKVVKALLIELRLSKQLADFWKREFKKEQRMSGHFDRSNQSEKDVAIAKENLATAQKKQLSDDLNTKKREKDQDRKNRAILFVEDWDAKRIFENRNHYTTLDYIYTHYFEKLSEDEMLKYYGSKGKPLSKKLFNPLVKAVRKGTFA